MPFSVKCSCGRVLLFEKTDRYAKGVCPSCGALIDLSAAVPLGGKVSLPETPFAQELYSSAFEASPEERLIREYFHFRALGFTEERGWQIELEHPSRSRWQKSGFKEIPIDLLIGRKLPGGKKFIPLILVAVRRPYDDSEEELLNRAFGQARVPAFEPHVSLTVAVYNGARRMFDTYTGKELPRILPPEEVLKRLEANQQPEPILTRFPDYRKVLRELLTKLPPYLKQMPETGLSLGAEYRKALLERQGVASEQELASWQAHREVRVIFDRLKHLMPEVLGRMFRAFEGYYFPELRELKKIQSEREEVLGYLSRTQRASRSAYLLWFIAGGVASLLNWLQPLAGLAVYVVLFLLGLRYHLALRSAKPTLERYDLGRFVSLARGRQGSGQEVLLVLAAAAAVAFVVTFLMTFGGK